MFIIFAPLIKTNITMPGHDTTGPMGDGPMTGRRMGRCVGEKSQNFSRNGRFGFGGRGTRRFGMMHSNNESNSFMDLISDLKDQINSLKNDVSILKSKYSDE